MKKFSPIRIIEIAGMILLCIGLTGCACVKVREGVSASGQQERFSVEIADLGTLRFVMEETNVTERIYRFTLSDTNGVIELFTAEHFVPSNVPITLVDLYQWSFLVAATGAIDRISVILSDADNPRYFHFEKNGKTWAVVHDVIIHEVDLGGPIAEVSEIQFTSFESFRTLLRTNLLHEYSFVGGTLRKDGLPFDNDIPRLREVPSAP